MSILEKLKPEIDASVARLAAKKFKIDPIAGKKYSRVPSVVGSMQKRHGLIVEKAIFEAIQSFSNYTVWTEPSFKVSNEVNVATSNINNVKQNPDWLHLLNHDHPYGNQSTTLQVDIMAYNKDINELYALEVKRGYSLHDAGKKKSILRSALAVQMLLLDYGKKELGVEKISKVACRICNYYKAAEFNSKIQIDKDDLDSFFGVPIYSMVEEVNNYFRTQIHLLMGDEVP